MSISPVIANGPKIFYSAGKTLVMTIPAEVAQKIFEKDIRQQSLDQPFSSINAEVSNEIILANSGKSWASLFGFGVGTLAISAVAFRYFRFESNLRERFATALNQLANDRTQLSDLSEQIDRFVKDKNQSIFYKLFYLLNPTFCLFEFLQSENDLKERCAPIFKQVIDDQVDLNQLIDVIDNIIADKQQSRFNRLFDFRLFFADLLRTKKIAEESLSIGVYLYGLRGAANLGLKSLQERF